MTWKKRFIPVICSGGIEGRSYGVKAYEFPAQGMTKQWAHFDRKQCPITTNDLHLSWDVPCTGEVLKVIGYDEENRVVSKTELLPPGKVAHLTAESDCASISADGESVVQVEIALRDDHGWIVENADRPISVTVENGTLLSLDNGDPSDHTLYSQGRRRTFGERAFAVIRGGRGTEAVVIRVESDNLSSVKIIVPVEG